MEDNRPGIREQIIAEAHYLLLWFHGSAEIPCLLGIVLFRDWAANDVTLFRRLKNQETSLVKTINSIICCVIISI